MENTFMSHELEQMRSQIGILKEKLEKQAIVNERHIRNSMKSKMSDINRVIAGSIFAGVFAIPYCTWFFYTQGLSLYFVVATVVMLAVCLGLTISKQVVLKRLDFSKGNLVEVASKLSKIRKHYQEWYKVAIPMLTVWFAWLMYEMIHTLGTEPRVIGFCCGALVGGLVGGIIGFRINKKVIDKASEILANIDDLQKGNQ